MVLPLLGKQKPAILGAYLSTHQLPTYLRYLRFPGICAPSKLQGRHLFEPDITLPFVFLSLGPLPIGRTYAA